MADSDGSTKLFLPGLTVRNLAKETTAGVTLLAIAVPLNIGYAQIAGLPATAGLYALVVPAIVYAVLVSSRQLVVSPDAAAAALVASSLGGLAVAGSDDYATMALAQAIICGVLFILCAVFKLGFLANFLSKPILVGFVGGLAFNILVSQFAKMMGISIDSGAEFVEKTAQVVTNLGTLNGWSVLISVLSIVVLLGGRRLASGVPWALVVLIVATVAVVLTNLQDAGVSVLGAVEAGPPKFTWPSLSWQQWMALVPSAIALTMVTMAEGLLVARSYSEKRGYPDKPNRDLFAFGAANIAVGLTGSFAAGSSTSRTAAMDQAGSRTQLPSIVAAIGTLLLLIFGTALLSDIPSPAIGAIVAVAIIPLLGIREFREMWRQDRFEFTIGLVCFLATLFIGSIPGILIAFVLALINIAKRAASPAIDVLGADDRPVTARLGAAAPGTMTAPGLIIIRLAAPLFFANGTVFSDAVKAAVAAAPKGEVHTLVIDLEAVTDIDITGAEAFTALKGWLHDNDITLGLSRAREGLIERMQLLELLDGEAVYDTNREAIAAVTG